MFQIEDFPDDAVLKFQEGARFLSNFYTKLFEFNGVMWPTAEHAYQAMKTLDPEKQEFIRRLPTAGGAKRAGREIELRPDWDRVIEGSETLVKDLLMYRIVKAKFRDPELATMLWQTGARMLVEGNYWGDSYWGVDYRKGGLNKLGRILMRVRSGLLAREEINHSIMD